MGSPPSEQRKLFSVQHHTLINLESYSHPLTYKPSPTTTTPEKKKKIMKMTPIASRFQRPVETRKL